jgi:hypothetical protein
MEYVGARFRGLWDVDMLESGWVDAGAVSWFEVVWSRRRAERDGRGEC